VQLLSGSVEGDLSLVGDKILFAHHINGKLTLWVSDGTDAGTVPLSSVVSLFPVGPVVLGRLNGVAVFNWNGALWRTDGTPDGTVQIADRKFNYGVALGDRLALVVFGPLGPVDIWTTDATPQGTTKGYSIASVAVLEPVAVAGTWYLPIGTETGYKLLNVKTGTVIGLSSSPPITVMPFNSPRDHRFAASGSKLLFAGWWYPKDGELWAYELGGEASPLPLLTVRYRGLTNVGRIPAAVFTIDVDRASGITPTVQFSTTDGSALQGRDYTATTATVTVTRYEPVTVVVPIAPNAHGTFNLVLSNAQNGIIRAGVATANTEMPVHPRAVKH
jgi:hypothetical protein